MPNDTDRPNTSCISINSGGGSVNTNSRSGSINTDSRSGSINTGSRSGSISTASRSGSISTNSRSLSNVKSDESNEIDIICSEDLIDVDNDISLGNSSETDEGMSIGSLEYVYNGSRATIPQGYIDDTIVEDVMRDADERLDKKELSPLKKVVMGVFVAAVISVVIIGSSMKARKDILNEEVEQRIRERSSAFEFKDHDEFAEPVLVTVSRSEKASSEVYMPLFAFKTESRATDYNYSDFTAEGLNLDESNLNRLKTEFNLTEVNMTGVNMTDANMTVNIRSILETENVMEYEVFPSDVENVLLDFKAPLGNHRQQIPFFWQVPFAGGVFQSFMTACDKKILASNHRKDNDDTLEIHMVRQSPFVNVDLSTDEGIESAARKGLIQSKLADVIVSNQVRLPTSTLFDRKHEGRFFTALRHPIDRCISEYHYVISTTTDPDVKKMSLIECAESPNMDKDWITRFLINKRQVPLVHEDLQLAKEILRKKCLIGLHENVERSMDLFEQYFGWTSKNRREKDANKNCKSVILDIEHNRARDAYRDVGDVTKGSEIYNKLVELNSFDMKLYWYAYDLFEEQLLWVSKNREAR